MWAKDAPGHLDLSVGGDGGCWRWALWMLGPMLVSTCPGLGLP